MTNRISERHFANATLLLFSLLFIAFFLSSAFLTNCGTIAGCDEIKGSAAARMIQLDTDSLINDLYVAQDTIKRAPDNTPIATKPGPHHKILMIRLERRYVWAFFAGVSTVLSIISLILAIVVAIDLGEGSPEPTGDKEKESGPKQPPRKRPIPKNLVRALLVIVPTVAVAIVLYLARRESGVVYPLLEATIANPRAAVGMPALPEIIALLNALSTAVAVALAVAVWFMLQPMRATSITDSNDSKRDLADLKRRALYLQLFLYFGTAALVTGVLRMNSTIYWMQSYLPELHQESFDSFRVTLVSVIGGFYSILLASLFFPAAAIIKARGRAAVADAPTDAKAEADDVEKEFAMPWSKLLPRIIAILGPLLAGPIGEFLKKLLPD